jgi:hypothetical protein
MNYLNHMSASEVAFIRVYVGALRRHYSALRTVVDIMNPDSLEVKDFYTATRVAVGMEELQADFETALHGLRKKHKLKHRRENTQPTTDDLVDLFELSFFKLVTAQKSVQNSKMIVNSHDGWFSGKPEEWANTLKTCKNLPPSEENLIPDLLSNCFNALAKFFNAHSKFNKNGLTKKIWPPAFDAPDIDDGVDNPENPFDWLFDNDDDD